MTRTGLFDGIPDHEYHADKGSLSQSGAKLLLGKSPAHFKWQRDNGQVEKREFDFGHIAHAEVLGTGLEHVILRTDVKKATKTTPAVIGDATNRRSNYTQDHEKAIREEGKVPLLAEEYAVVQAMAAAIKAHPLASRLFDPEHGKAEQSGYFTDKATGVLRRFRLDWQPEIGTDPYVVPDYKTTVDASPRAITRYLANYGYAMQAAWYLDGISATTGITDAEFLLVLQEKVAPYVVTVAQPDAMALQWGAERNRQALELYAKCVAEDDWPAYANDIVPVSVPDWALADLEMGMD